jgi:hypothetical protein
MHNVKWMYVYPKCVAMQIAMYPVAYHLLWVVIYVCDNCLVLSPAALLWINETCITFEEYQGPSLYENYENSVVHDEEM